MWAVLAAAVLFALAAVVGTYLQSRDGSVHLRWPPLYAWWEPHIGPGTPAALTVAAVVIGYGPATARRLGWRAVVWTSWCTAMAWTWSLALIDGWHQGIARRLTTTYEYLQAVDDVDGIGATLRGWTDHILAGTPDQWPAHVAGHPPAALLTFVGLDRIGLDGGGWAGIFCITVGTSAVAAVLLAVRALAGEHLARRAAPFLVLAPAAVWWGASADAYFSAVAAWAVALLALAATRTVRTPRTAALGSGLLFGLLFYLSYGLTLMAVVAAVVLVLTRTAWPVPLLVLGVLPWIAAFTLAGFWWYEGYDTLVVRYHQGAGGVRPYGYFIWANLAANVVTVGLATVAALRRTALQVPSAARELRRGPVTGRRSALVVLVAGAVCALLIADLSGMSKAETERIWLPFTLWLLPATALLPAPERQPEQPGQPGQPGPAERRPWRGRRGAAGSVPGLRWWLGAQAAVALTVNHLLFTGW